MKELNKYEVFTFVIIAVFIIVVFLIKPSYTGFVVYELIGDKIYVEEAFYEEDNVTVDIKTLDGDVVKVKKDNELNITFLDFLNNGYKIDMFLIYKEDTNIVIYENSNVVGFFYFNETGWNNITLNLSSMQNKFSIYSIDGKVDLDYIEVTVMEEKVDALTYDLVESNVSSADVGENILHTTKWKGNSSMFIFSSNYSNQWLNETAQDLVDWSNFTKSVNNTGNYGWHFYANNTKNEFNKTSLQTVLIEEINVTNTTIISTTTTTIENVVESSNSRDDAGSKIFLSEEALAELAEESSQKTNSEETESGEIAEVIKENSDGGILLEERKEGFVTERKVGDTEVVGNLILENIKRPNLIKSLILVVIGISLFMIYWKNKIRKK